MPTRRAKQPEQLVALAAMLDRDLATLRREVEAYPDERDLWREVPGVPNVGGTLVLHLTGNLQHYFGARLAGTGYVRDRPAEFARRNVPRPELLRSMPPAPQSKPDPVPWARRNWQPIFRSWSAAPESRPVTISCTSRSTLHTIWGSSTIIAGS